MQMFHFFIVLHYISFDCSNFLLLAAEWMVAFGLFVFIVLLLLSSDPNVGRFVRLDTLAVVPVCLIAPVCFIVMSIMSSCLLCSVYTLKMFLMFNQKKLDMV